MMRFLLSTLLVVLFVVFILFTIYYLPSIGPVFACHEAGQPIPAGQPNHPPNQPARPEDGPCPAGLNQIEDLFRQIISVVVGLGFVALLILLVLSGFKYLTSGGEQKAVYQAHMTATWALLGILFMAIAWLVLQLISAFTGVDVTFFNIKALY